MTVQLIFILGCSSSKDTANTAQPASEPSTEESPTEEPSSEPDVVTDTSSSEPASEPIEPYASARIATDTHLLEYAPEETVDNPFRGFLTNYDWSEPANDLPHSLEFRYLPLSSVVLDENIYDYTVLEDALNTAKDRGNHLILRFYLDYPTLDSGMPNHLSNVVSCTPYEDYGGGCTPDYENPDLQSTLLSFIDDFGLNYDGDQRLAFIQIGLLGFWGEWHTYPHTDLFASDQVQQDIITAFDQSFSTTPIQLRYPSQDSSSRNIGFHDDSFAYATIGSTAWFFQPRLEAAQANLSWQNSPIGGEVYPALQSLLFTEEYTIETHQQDLQLCLEETHASYLLNYFAFSGSGTGYTGAQKEQAEVFSQGMGYQYTITQIDIVRSNLEDYLLDWSIDITLSNEGNAPSYYPIALNLSWNNEIYELQQVQDLLPDTTTTVSFSLNDLPREQAQMPFELFLNSDFALPEQQIKLANTSSSTGSVLIHDPIFCAYEGLDVELGETVDFNGLLCTCDVDRQLYSSDGESCSP